jgi:hypothetical protein
MSLGAGQAGLGFEHVDSIQILKSNNFFFFFGLDESNRV